MTPTARTHPMTQPGAAANINAETGLNSLHLPGRPQDNRVVVAMSGGVDSSVVAGLLVREGYDVVGITLQLYDHGAALAKKGACCAGQDINDARAVADRLGIPHYVLDYESRFSDAVINNFADSYLAGETPVPCIRCNQSVKFRDLLATAKDLGAAALATGHYIASGPGPYGWEMRRAVDADRDQSYFLFATTRDQLSFVRFPLGSYRKDDVRALASEMGLAVATKSDSQDICFVPNGKYADVIAKLRPEANRPGRIVHLDGRDLGAHDGIVGYTIGQRRGLGIATGDPLFVVRLDAASATVVVGPRQALETASLTLRDLNWLGAGDLAALPADGLPVYVRIRSTSPPAPARLYSSAPRKDTSSTAPDDLRANVVLDQPEMGVSPGQACVFYSDGSGTAQVLGGGWIATTRTVTGNERTGQNAPSVAADDTQNAGAA